MTPVVRFLPTCKISGTPSPCQARLFAAHDTAARHFGHDVTVTCVEEGHGPNDPHTKREATDSETVNLTAAETRALYDFYVTDLGPLFTVLYEAPDEPTDPVLRQIWYVDPNATGPHLHLQSAMSLGAFPRYPPSASPAQ